jgi:hypothetical protein
VARIWKAVTRLSPLVGPVAADVAPTKVGAKKSPTTGRRAVVARPAAKRGAEPALARSKKTDVLALMRRDGGATLAEIIQLTGWQPHQVLRVTITFESCVFLRSGRADRPRAAFESGEDLELKYSTGLASRTLINSFAGRRNPAAACSL